MPQLDIKISESIVGVHLAPVSQPDGGCKLIYAPDSDNDLIHASKGCERRDYSNDKGECLDAAYFGDLMGVK